MKVPRARLAVASKLARLRGVQPADAAGRLGFRRALETYRPALYTGGAVLFRAAKLPLGISVAADLGWGPLVARLELETLPGYFTTAISQPGVRVLAERLARRLRA